MALTLTISGLAELESRLAVLAAESTGLGDDAIETEADRLLEASKAVCPVATGALVASAKVLPLEHDGDSVTATLTYDTPYAVFVHEGHRIVAWGHDTGRQQPPNKFLESPVLAEAGSVGGHLAGTLGPVIERLFS